MAVVVLNPKNEATARIISSAVKFYSHILLNKKANKISIFVKCDEPLGDTEAETCWLDTNLEPKMFQIRLAKKIKNFRRIIQTIAHEMVHVKQFVKGEMEDIIFDETKIKWKRKIINMNHIEYWDYPWEIEAYGREIGLYMKFKEFFEVSDKQLTNPEKLDLDIFTRTDYNTSKFVIK